MLQACPTGAAASLEMGVALSCAGTGEIDASAQTIRTTRDEAGHVSRSPRSRPGDVNSMDGRPANIFTARIDKTSPPIEACIESPEVVRPAAEAAFYKVVSQVRPMEERVTPRSGTAAPCVVMLARNQYGLRSSSERT